MLRVCPFSTVSDLPSFLLLPLPLPLPPPVVPPVPPPPSAAAQQPLTRLLSLSSQERVGGHPSSLGPITSIGGVGGSASFASTPRIHTPTTDFQPPYFPPPYLGTENQMTVSTAPPRPVTPSPRRLRVGTARGPLWQVTQYTSREHNHQSTRHAIISCTCPAT